MIVWILEDADGQRIGVFSSSGNAQLYAEAIFPLGASGDLERRVWTEGSDRALLSEDDWAVRPEEIDAPRG